MPCALNAYRPSDRKWCGLTARATRRRSAPRRAGDSRGPMRNPENAQRTFADSVAEANGRAAFLSSTNRTVAHGARFQTRDAPGSCPRGERRFTAGVAPAGTSVDRTTGVWCTPRISASVESALMPGDRVTSSRANGVAPASARGRLPRRVGAGRVTEGCRVICLRRGRRNGTPNSGWSSDVSVRPSISSESVSHLWGEQIRSVICSPAGHEFNLRQCRHTMSRGMWRRSRTRASRAQRWKDAET